jgi:hypothetical protein
MQLNIFLAIVAVIFAVFGLGLLFMPAEFMAFYGLNYNPAGVLTARVFGTQVLLLAVIYWAARNAGPSSLMSAILWGSVIANILDAVIAFMGISAGVLNAMGWALVVLHVLLAVGFIYYATRR